MKAKVLKIIEQPAKSNAIRASKCYIICLKTDDGKSYRTWTDDHMGNFKRWYQVIVGFVQCQKDGRELWLEGLTVKVKGLVDADSLFTITIKDAAPAAFVPDHNNASRETSGRKDLD